MPKSKYYVYIITNRVRRHLYIGVTNSLSRRLQEHHENRGSEDSWAGRRWCFLLVYYEEFASIREAIEREKQLKRWRRSKKEWLIKMKNPEWRFLNSDFDAQY